MAQNWQETQKLVASDREGRQSVGYAVCLSGDFAFAGSLGAVLAYKRDENDQWALEQEIVPELEVQNSSFGLQLAADGNNLLIYASGETITVGDSTYESVGTVYAFQYNANGEWEQTQRFNAPFPEPYAAFGSYLAIDGKTALIGAPRQSSGGLSGPSIERAGATYVYEQDNVGLWQYKQLLLPSSRQLFAGAGHSIALQGKTAFVGAFSESLDDGNGTMLAAAGAIYVFEEDEQGNWVEVQKLVASEKEELAYFGGRIDLHGNDAIIGAYREFGLQSGNPVESGGSVFFFKRNAQGIWSEHQKLFAANRQRLHFFGIAVAIHENYALVGTDATDQFPVGQPVVYNSGSAYLFNKNAQGDWHEVQEFVPSDVAAGDNAGSAVALGRHEALIGSYSDDFEGPVSIDNDAGAAFVFAFAVPTGSATESKLPSLLLYPNPTVGRFNITGLQTDTPVSLRIYDVRGKLVYQEGQIAGSSFSHELNGPAGLYLIQLSTAEGAVGLLKVQKW